MSDVAVGGAGVVAVCADRFAVVADDDVFAAATATAAAAAADDY